MTEKTKVVRPTVGHAPLKVHLVLLLCVFLICGLFTAGTFASNTIDPGLFIGLRYVTAMPVLIYLKNKIGRPHAKLTTKQHGWLLLGGALGVWLNQYLSFMGSARSSATTLGLLTIIPTIFVSGVDMARGREEVHVQKIGGLIFAIVGTVVTVGFDGASFTWGAVMIVGNMICYGIFLLMQPFLLKFVDSISLVFYCMVYTLPWALGFSLFYLSDLAKMTALLWVIVVYSGVVTTGITYYLYSWAISHSGPALVSTYNLLFPPVTAFMAWMTLGDEIVLRHFIGGALSLIGMTLIVHHKLLEARRGAEIETPAAPAGAPMALEEDHKVYPPPPPPVDDHKDEEEMSIMGGAQAPGLTPAEDSTV